MEISSKIYIYVLFYTCVEQLLRLFYASIFIFKQGKAVRS